jgi:hypothetical protein
MKEWSVDNLLIPTQFLKNENLTVVYVVASQKLDTVPSVSHQQSGRRLKMHILEEKCEKRMLLVYLMAP